jgi:hypothetical protein
VTHHPIRIALKRPLLLLRCCAGLALVVGLAVLGSRLGIEWLWFSQFGDQGVALKRWLIQIVTFLLVMGLGGFSS